MHAQAQSGRDVGATMANVSAINAVRVGYQEACLGLPKRRGDESPKKDQDPTRFCMEDP